MTEEELASLNQLLLTIRKEYIGPINNYLKIQFNEIARFFKTVIQWLVTIWNERIPDTFIITKEQYVILVIACLILCFHRDKKKKEAKQEYKQQVINEAKKLNQLKQTMPKGPKILGKNWYPTGWTYNEAKKLWEPPDYLKTEAKDRWVWDPEKEIWIDLYKNKQ